jgi:hypothetical protein
MAVAITSGAYHTPPPNLQLLGGNVSIWTTGHRCALHHYSVHRRGGGGGGLSPPISGVVGVCGARGSARGQVSGWVWGRTGRCWVVHDCEVFSLFW